MTAPDRQSSPDLEALALYRKEVEELYRRLIGEVVNEGNFEVVDEIVGSDFVMRVAGDPEPIQGPTGLKAHIQLWHTAFPDLHVAIDEVLIDGYQVIGRWTLTGTHENEFMGIEPSGARISIWGVEIDRVKDGEIVEVWEIVDTLSLLQQLGVSDPLTE